MQCPREPAGLLPGGGGWHTISPPPPPLPPAPGYREGVLGVSCREGRGGGGGCHSFCCPGWAVCSHEGERVGVCVGKHKVRRNLRLPVSLPPALAPAAPDFSALTGCIHTSTGQGPVAASPAFLQRRCRNLPVVLDAKITKKHVCRKKIFLKITNLAKHAGKMSNFDRTTSTKA